MKSSGIDSLTEYGRVVHAKMEALLMCARNNISCNGGTLYATTFPCHNCAKHIIAAGLQKVVYIEPYPKSKALEFYTKEITEKNDDVTKVQFVPFYGVGPHRYIDLFSVKSIFWYERKRKNDNGDAFEWIREKSNVRTTLNPLNYIESELAAHTAFETEIEKIKEVFPHE